MPSHTGLSTEEIAMQRAKTAAVIIALEELTKAQVLHVSWVDAHQGIGVITEEFEELKREVFKKEADRNMDAMRLKQLSLRPWD